MVGGLIIRLDHDLIRCSVESTGLDLPVPLLDFFAIIFHDCWQAMFVLSKLFLKLLEDQLVLDNDLADLLLILQGPAAGITVVHGSCDKVWHQTYLVLAACCSFR